MADRSLHLIEALAVPAAGTYVTEWLTFRPQSVRDINFQSTFDYGSGGTTLKVYLQTSIDGGATAVDVASHAFATTDARKVSAVKRNNARAEAVATDGALGDDAELGGLIGDRIRIKYVVAGTYADSTLDVDVVLG